MNNSITNRQMFFILLLTLTSLTPIVFAQTMSLSAGQGAWFTILLTALVFAAMAAVLVKLHKMYEGKSLFDYSRDIAGRYASYAFAIYYILYFFTVAVYLLIGFTALIHADFLIETPEWAVLLAGLPVYGLMAYRGITNVARLTEIYGIVFLILSIIINVTMIIEGNINHLLPVFNPSEAGQYILSTKDALIAFLGIEVLTIVPFTKKNKKAPLKAFITLIVIALWYVLLVEGCYAMVGPNELAYRSDALITAIRLVEYPSVEFLQRIDILYLTFGFFGVFCGIGIVYLTLVEYLCRLFPKAKRLLIVVLAGIAMFIVTTSVFTIPDMEKILTEAVTYGGLMAAFFIPLLLFAIAKVKRNAEKDR